MNDYTIDNPGCWHSALKYLSELTGIEQRKEIEVSSMDGLYSKPHKHLIKKKRKLLFKAYDIYGIDHNGNRFAFYEDNKRFDERGLQAVKFAVQINRALDEFGIDIKDEKKYKDSLGNGWYQMVPMISINGQFFAQMDCSC